MTLGALLVLAQHERHLPQLVRHVKAGIQSTQSRQLHFRTLSDAKKLAACSMIAERNVQAFAMCSHKPNMQGHRNDAAATVGPRGWFYNWCIRLLLERITDFVERDSKARFGEPRVVKLVFAERGGVRYHWLDDYIRRLMLQSKTATLVLDKRDVKATVLDRKMVEVVPAHSSAGCQLADAIASAFHCAADAAGPRWNIEPAIALEPIMPKEAGYYHDYSVSLQPSFFRTTSLTTKQKMIFEHYGYDFRVMR
jgi:hypothetical protein